MKNWEGDESRWSTWLAQAQKGDVAKYEALLSELAPAIRSYLIVCFGRIECLDDCVQESLLAVHQARHTYNPRRPVRPWLFAIIRHRTIDLLRKSHYGTRSGAAQISVNEAVGHETGAMENPDLSADWNREIDGSRLLRNLTHKVRDALVLTKVHGLSHRECAAKLGVSESVVKVRVHRGIRQLRVLWEAESP